jgi:undecaprenyl-diphosphatase
LGGKLDIIPVILGIVQGISEWLPISSKTQELLVSHYLLDISLTVAYSFGLFMEVGSIGSAVTYFRNDIVKAIRDRFTLTFLIVVTVVTGVVGVPLYLISDRILEGAYNPGLPMAILGVILIGNGFYIRHSRRRPREFKEMKLREAIVVGLAQGLAALPGVSRSGMTVSTMLLLGLKGEDAFKYSYLSYIPAALGAVGTTLLFSKSNITTVATQLGEVGILIAIISSLVTGLLVIGLLLRVAKTKRIYLLDFALGLIALTVSLIALA